MVLPARAARTADRIVRKAQPRLQTRNVRDDSLPALAAFGAGCDDGYWAVAAAGRTRAVASARPTMRVCVMGAFSSSSVMSGRPPAAVGARRRRAAPPADGT